MPRNTRGRNFLRVCPGAHPEIRTAKRTQAPKRQRVNVGFTLEGAHEVPAQRHPAHREYTDDIQLPTVAPRNGPHAGRPGQESPLQALAGCGIRPRVEGPDRGHADERRLRGAAPPGSVKRLASGQRSTDSIGAGTENGPGLQTPGNNGHPGMIKPGASDSASYRSHGTISQGSRARPHGNSDSSRLAAVGQSTKTENTSRAGGYNGPGWAGTPFLSEARRTCAHQSRRGDLPGREEVWVGFQQLRSAAFHLPHSTRLPWPQTGAQTFGGPEVTGGGVV
ncbi:Kinesin motor domain family protein [Aspergillus niger]|uniref:Kinesin motor domain family protein n=1 Tax=Aspergillus niger TaxID=5061 RepID=A0A505HUJ9_ASPNG|nr:Kinesin motor domain family protein [Aspergillus niger]